MTDKPHHSPFGLYGPYDPVKHHHHRHPPFMVDRCAEQCDDQLPLFSQVGRGLQGNGYEVRVKEDGLFKTILEGLVYDPHTGTYEHDWDSENINGGHLSFGYTLREWTDPKTFVIAFRYVRPGRKADENGTVWSWTSPAIPYVWDEGDKNIAAGVATLYLRKAGEVWDWRKHEKLKYPDYMDHNSMNAPDPEEPYTVNLTYGIGDDSDFDVPSTDDIAKIIGITPAQIKRLVKQAVPTDSFPNDMNTKQYIDSIRDMIRYYNVVSSKPGALAVSSTTNEGTKTTTFTLTPAAPVAGQGIKVTESSNGRITIATKKIRQGPGIQVVETDDDITIINTLAGGSWRTLVPGEDFNFTWQQGWYAGPRLDGNTPLPSSPDKTVPPIVRIIPTFDNSGNLVSAQVRVSASRTTPEEVYLQNSRDVKLESNFMFAHSNRYEPYNSDGTPNPDFQGTEVAKSGILRFWFLNNPNGQDWTPLNSFRVNTHAGYGNNIWNVRGTDGAITSASSAWANIGASWEVQCGVAHWVGANAAGKDNTFYIYAVGLSDGYNDQYHRHARKTDSTQEWAHMAVKPWANWGHELYLDKIN